MLRKTKEDVGADVIFLLRPLRGFWPLRFTCLLLLLGATRQAFGESSTGVDPPQAATSSEASPYGAMVPVRKKLPDDLLEKASAFITPDALDGAPATHFTHLNGPAWQTFQLAPAPQEPAAQQAKPAWSPKPPVAAVSRAVKPSSRPPVGKHVTTARVTVRRQRGDADRPKVPAPWVELPSILKPTTGP